jgi:hypothetical protein
LQIAAVVGRSITHHWSIAMRNPTCGIWIGVGIALLFAGGTTSALAVADPAAAPQDSPPPAEALPPPSMDDPGTVAATPAPDRRSKKAVRDALAPPGLPAESAPASIPLAHASQDDAGMAPAPVGALTSTDPTPPKPSLTRSAVDPSKASDTHYSGEGITVNVRTMDNGDRIEEYRSGGQLTRVKVTPRKAPPYEIIDSNGNGRLDDHDKNAQKTVGWTLFKWH